jgi:mannosyltransferase
MRLIRRANASFRLKPRESLISIMYLRGVNASETSQATKLEPAKGTHWLALLLVLFANIAVRLHCLSCKPFWFDESFSVEAARIDWRNFLHLMWWREANMSLYYVLLRIWLRFGQSPTWIRGLSVLMAAGALLAVYWVALLLFDHQVALMSAALLAFNAFDLRYSQEARSYELFLLLTALSSGFLISWLRFPTRRKRLGYITVSVLAAYAHFYALLLLAVHWIILRCWRSPDLNPPGPERKNQIRQAWIAIGIGVSPLVVFIAKTGAGPIKWIPRPGIHDLWNFFSSLTSGMPALYAAACCAAFIPVGRKFFNRQESWQQWRYQFLLLWLLFPIGLTFVLSFARPVFLPRYMIFCLPPLVILAAAGVASLRQRWAMAVSFLAILILSAQMIPFVYGNDFDKERDASGQASNFILDNGAPGDAIIFHIAETRVPYEFFRSIRAGENTASPKFAAKIGPEILFPRHAQGLDYRDFTGKPTAEFVTRLPAEYPRVWVMLMNNRPADKPDPTTLMLSQILPQSFPVMNSWQFNKVEVRLYRKK